MKDNEKIEKLREGQEALLGCVEKILDKISNYDERIKLNLKMIKTQQELIERLCPNKERRD